MKEQQLNHGHEKKNSFVVTENDDNGEMVVTQTLDNNEDSSFKLSPIVWNILVVETGERFAYFGFRAVLVLYFVDALQFNDRQAIACFAYTTFLAYASPIVGAVLADGVLGRYTTIMWFGIVYWIGLVILTAGAKVASGTNDDGSLTGACVLSFGGLFLVCLGTGGIKPCVSSFGADQVALSRSHDVGNSHPDGTPSLVRDNKSGGGHEGYDRVPNSSSSTTPTTQRRQERAVRAFFSYFYVSINVGATVSIAIVPLARDRFGFATAFALPTAFMAMALILFWSKRHQYIHHRDNNTSLTRTFRLCWWLLQRNVLASWPQLTRAIPVRWQPGPSPPLYSGRQTSQQHILLPTKEDDDDDLGGGDVVEAKRNDTKNSAATEAPENGEDGVDSSLLHQKYLDDAAMALHVLPIMAMLPIFWCLYDQQGSVWTLQAKRMELNGLQPEQMCLINPIEIMILVPLFEKCIYPRLPPRHVRPLRRMSVGMLLTAVSFAISGVVEYTIRYRDENNMPKVNVFWQLPQLTILAVGEVFVSVTGLEFSYATSPESLKAFLMAVYLLTTAVGDLFGGILYSTVFESLSMANVMYVCAALMLGNLALFCRVAQWWERHSSNDLLQRALTSSAPGQQVELVTPQQRIV